MPVTAVLHWLAAVLVQATTYVNVPLRAWGSKVVALPAAWAACLKISVLKKKNALLRMTDKPPSPKRGRTTGPLIVPPNWFRFKNARETPLKLLKNEFAPN